MTDVSDDVVAEIKRFLFGVAPGPWKRHPNAHQILSADGSAIVDCWSETDARYIARLDPSTIRSLLARMESAETKRDAYSEQVAFLMRWKNAISEDRILLIQQLETEKQQNLTLENQVIANGEHIVALENERNKLRSMLDTIADVFSKTLNVATRNEEGAFANEGRSMLAKIEEMKV